MIAFIAFAVFVLIVMLRGSGIFSTDHTRTIISQLPHTERSNALIVEAKAALSSASTGDASLDALFDRLVAYASVFAEEEISLMVAKHTMHLEDDQDSRRHMNGVHQYSYKEAHKQIASAFGALVCILAIYTVDGNARRASPMLRNFKGYDHPIVETDPGIDFLLRFESVFTEFDYVARSQLSRELRHDHPFLFATTLISRAAGVLEQVVGGSTLDATIPVSKDGSSALFTAMRKVLGNYMRS